MPRWPLGALIHVSRIVISVDALVSRSVCALRSAERCAADDDAARFDTAISVSNKSGWLVLDARAVVLIVGVQRFGLHAAAVASRRPLRCLHDLRAAVSLVAVDAPLPRLWRALLPRVLLASSGQHRRARAAARMRPLRLLRDASRAPRLRAAARVPALQPAAERESMLDLFDALLQIGRLLRALPVVGQTKARKGDGGRDDVSERRGISRAAAAQAFWAARWREPMLIEARDGAWRAVCRVRYSACFDEATRGRRILRFLDSAVR